MNSARFGDELRRLDGRNGEIAHRYYMLGESQRQIGEALGIGQQRVSQILAEIRGEIDGTTREDVRAGMAQRMASLRNAMAKLVDMDGTPVTAGKDGTVVVDPESGEVVRDYGLRVNAAREIRAIEERLAKLYGADEPTRVKTDMTVHGETEVVSSLAEEARAALNED